jgi:MinD-like ATPase involved in chromosome partitioning or flagellar assembly
MIPTVFIVGADKGGVGKTTVSRLLLDYFFANGIDFKAYDTEFPSGALQRFYPEHSEIVDLTRSMDQMRVFDNMGAAQAIVLDIRAGLMSKTLQLLKEIGFFELAKQNKIRIVGLHVIGPSTQSLEELPAVAAALQGQRHVVVANHINDTEFNVPAGALVISKLDEAANEAVDKTAKPYGDYEKGAYSFVLRGKVRHWMGEAFEQFTLHKLNVFA